MARTPLEIAQVSVSGACGGVASRCFIIHLHDCNDEILPHVEA